MSCAGRVVVITGAGRGLGRSHALALAAAGAKVIVNDLGVSREGASTADQPAFEVVEEILKAGGEAVASGEDITTWDGAGRVVAQAIARFGRLDVVVNNAGFVRDRMFVNATLEEWQATMRVHLDGHFCVTRHATDHWRSRIKGGELPTSVDARIINTTSGAGLFGSVGQAAYSAAKAGIIALTLVQAAELSRYGITANAIAPAARTRMTEVVFASTMERPESGFDSMSPEHVSPLVVFLAGSGACDVSGRVFEVQGGKLMVAEGWHTGPGLIVDGPFTSPELEVGLRAALARSRLETPVYGA